MSLPYMYKKNEILDIIMTKQYRNMNSAKTTLKRLEQMQDEFKHWVNTMEFDKENASYYELIENRLMKIAKENEYKYIMKFNTAGPSHIFLIFQNKENSKFIGAFANEKGFIIEESDHID